MTVPTIWCARFPRRQRSPPSRSQIPPQSALSLASPHQHTHTASSSLPSKRLQLHYFQNTVPRAISLTRSPSSPLLHQPSPAFPTTSLNLVCGTRIFGKYPVDHSFTRLLGPAVSTPSPNSGFKCLPDRAFAFILSTTPPRSATDTALPLVTLPPSPNHPNRNEMFYLFLRIHTISKPIIVIFRPPSYF